tara:strand:- start:9955 stop:10926 length:972 start_codon:yes stop_codon:yes gene_type:complete
MFDQMVSEILNKNLIEENNAKTIAAIVGLWATGFSNSNAEYAQQVGAPGLPVDPITAEFGSNSRAITTNLRSKKDPDIKRYPIQDILKVSASKKVQTLDQINFWDLENIDAFIAKVKELEGFNPNPYWDRRHYSIGYGTYARSMDQNKTDKSYDYVARYQPKLNQDQLKRFDNRESIHTPNIRIMEKDEAEMRLIGELIEHTKAVRNFIERNGLLETHKSLTYGQVYAMIDMRYNMGPDILQKLLVNKFKNPARLITPEEVLKLLQNDEGKLETRREFENDLFKSKDDYFKSKETNAEKSLRIDNLKLPDPPDDFKKRKFSIR